MHSSPFLPVQLFATLILFSTLLAGVLPSPVTLRPRTDNHPKVSKTSQTKTPAFEILEFHLIRQRTFGRAILKVDDPVLGIDASETWTLAIMNQTATRRDSGFRTEPIVGGTADGAPSTSWQSVTRTRPGIFVTIKQPGHPSKILGTAKATVAGKRRIFHNWKDVDTNQPNLLYLDSLLSVLKQMESQDGISDMHLELDLNGEWLPMMKDMITKAGSAAGQHVEGQDWERYKKVLQEPRFKFEPQSPPTKAWEEAEEKRILGDGWKLEK